MSASVKHPQPLQLPQHPQPPRLAANHNLARPNLLDQAELGRLYKPACSNLNKASPSIAHSDLTETTSLGRSVRQQTKIGH